MGMIIIVVQGLLVIGLVILVVLGAISWDMSLTSITAEFSPKALESIRVQYFEYLQTSAADYNLSEVQRGWQNKLQEAEKDMAPIQPSFSVISVRRVSKIQDEDEDETILEALASDPNRASRPMRLGRRKSVSSRMSTHR
jgi:hypothetical protein